jgi:hypothetical protein
MTAGSVINIMPTSDVNWLGGYPNANSLYLTIVDDFWFWSKRMALQGSSWSNEGVNYTDQYDNCDPVCNMGGLMAVLKMPTGVSSASFVPDASTSWVLNSTITGYSWASTGASITNATSSSPIVSYSAVGDYRLDCTVTAANGKSWTGYRRVYVCNDAALASGSAGIVNQFSLSSCVGARDAAGWAFTVNMWGQVNLANIPDKAMCSLFAVDYYSGSAISIGDLSGYEMVMATGWVVGESLVDNPEQNSVQFTVEGPSQWMKRLGAYPHTVTDRRAASIFLQGQPANSFNLYDWIWFPNMTVDAAAWTLLHWRSTVDRFMDVIGNGDTTAAYSCNGQLGSFEKQLEDFTNIHNFAEPECDQYGRLFLEINAQYLPVSERGDVPNVMTLQPNDWGPEMTITRRTYPMVSMLTVDGYYWDGTTYSPVLAMANGYVNREFGDVKTISSLFLDDQNEANSAAALSIGRENNEIPSLSLTLQQNNRFFDITPCEYILISLSGSETPVGITWTNRRFIPIKIEYQYNPDTGMITVPMEFEAETFPENSITVTMPLTPFANIIPNSGDSGSGLYNVVPGWYPFNPPPTVQPPPSQSGSSGSSCWVNTSAPSNGPYNTGLSGTLDASTSNVAYFLGWARPNTYTYLTGYILDGQFQVWDGVNKVWNNTMADAFYNVYLADKNGGIVAQGTKNAVINQGYQRTGYFNLAAGTDFRYFMIAPSGSGTNAVSGSMSAYTDNNSGLWINDGLTQYYFGHLDNNYTYHGVIAQDSYHGPGIGNVDIYHHYRVDFPSAIGGQTIHFHFETLTYGGTPVMKSGIGYDLVQHYDNGGSNNITALITNDSGWWNNGGSWFRDYDVTVPIDILPADEVNNKWIQTRFTFEGGNPGAYIYTWSMANMHITPDTRIVLDNSYLLNTCTYKWV